MGYIIVFVIIVIIVILVVKGVSKSRKNKKRIEPAFRKEQESPRISFSITTSYNGIPSDISKLEKDAVFFGKNTTLKINGRELISPMVYTGEKKSSYSLPHVLYNNLKVSFDGVDEDMGYWPSYSNISPSSRGKLIEWLARGKTDIDLSIGLVFIFFYGLEFRAIQEGENHKDILLEVMRLHEIFSFNRSFRGYAESFIAWLVLKIDDFTQDEKQSILGFIKKLGPYSSMHNSGAEIKLSEEIFNKNNLFSIVSTDENTARSKLPEKLGNIFYEYFFTQLEPSWETIKNEVKKQQFYFQHHCASPVYSLNTKSKALSFNYSLSRSIKNKLAKIWTQCIEDLKPYSRKIGKASQEELFTYLPEKLREKYSHPLGKMFNNFVNNKLNSPCKVSEIIDILNGNYSERLTIKHSKDMCNTIEILGYNIEPDSRYTSQSYGWDDFCIIYKDEKPGIPKKATYAIASMLFDLGVFISSADGNIDEKELNTIEKFIKDNFCDNAIEKIRIEKRRLLALKGVIRGKGLGKRIAEKLAVSDLEKLGKYLFMVAATDGIIDKTEIKAIKTVCSDLGLNEEYYNNVIRELKIENIAVVEDSTRIRRGTKMIKQGTHIPEPILNKKENIKMDSVVLESVLKDTEKVKIILSEVFNKEDKIKSSSVESTKSTAIDEKINLPKDVSSFLEIIMTKSNWDKEEIRKIAIKNKIMLDTAIDKINYWWENNNGDYLIYEENGKYIIQKELLEQQA